MKGVRNAANVCFVGAVVGLLLMRVDVLVVQILGLTLLVLGGIGELILTALVLVNRFRRTRR